MAIHQSDRLAASPLNRVARELAAGHQPSFREFLRFDVCVEDFDNILVNLPPQPVLALDDYFLSALLRDKVHAVVSLKPAPLLDEIPFSPDSLAD